MQRFPVTVALCIILACLLVSMSEAACRSRWKVFTMASCKRSEQPNVKDYLTEFRIFDLNDDGVITFEEVNALEGFLKGMDFNGDQKVVLTEYIMDAEKSDTSAMDV
ncbi:uncharacterized protein [Ptychodera flava]|uniref:uncharacterized protein n=1 Tax=Ptychodera flava TaxID=63121 RepID=UPI00396A773A